MPKPVDSIAIEVCTDCMMWIANAETPVDLGQKETEEWIAKFEAATVGYQVVPGNESLGFSNRRCDICRALAGDREQAFLLD